MDKSLNKKSKESGNAVLMFHRKPKENVFDKLKEINRQHRAVSFKSMLRMFVNLPIIMFSGIFLTAFLIGFLLPFINMIGYKAFSFGEAELVCYFLVPYAAINIAVMLGAYKLWFYLIKRFCAFTKKVFDSKTATDDNDK